MAASRSGALNFWQDGPCISCELPLSCLLYNELVYIIIAQAERVPLETANDTARIAIVGGGEAAVAAAGRMRAAGYSGGLDIFSEERVRPYGRPPLSKAALMSASYAPEPIRSDAWFRDRRIDLHLDAHVEGVDPIDQRLFLAGQARRGGVAYDRLLIATGARARQFALLAPLDEKVAYLRTIADAMTLRGSIAAANSVAIVGGGVIGLEVASSCRALGKQVTVIEAAERLMARAVDASVSEKILDLHRSAGVDVRLSQCIVDACLDESGNARLILDSGDVVSADLVVAGVGVVPADELARSAGCACDNGILVDEFGRTNKENIFAAGDVARFSHPFLGRIRLEAWQHAKNHGTHVAGAMLGDLSPYSGIPWFWSDQHGHNLQVAGLPNIADEHVNRGQTTLHLLEGRLVGATTLDNARDIRPASKLIAAGWRGSACDLCNPEAPLRELVRNLPAVNSPMLEGVT